MVKQKHWNGKILSRGTKPIISIKEARKFLGEGHHELTDEEVMGIIYMMTSVVVAQLDQLEVPKND